MIKKIVVIVAVAVAVVIHWWMNEFCYVKWFAVWCWYCFVYLKRKWKNDWKLLVLRVRRKVFFARKCMYGLIDFCCCLDIDDQAYQQHKVWCNFLPKQEDMQCCCTSFRSHCRLRPHKDMCSLCWDRQCIVRRVNLVHNHNCIPLDCFPQRFHCLALTSKRSFQIRMNNNTSARHRSPLRDI